MLDDDHGHGAERAAAADAREAVAPYGPDVEGEVSRDGRLDGADAGVTAGGREHSARLR